MDEDKNLTEKLIPAPDNAADIEGDAVAEATGGENFLSSDLIETQDDSIDISDQPNDGPLEASDQPWTKGEKQPVRYRDAPFAVLFYIQVVAVIAVAICVPVKVTEGGNDGREDTVEDYSGLLYFSLIVAGSSFALTAISLAAMTKFSELLVQGSLLFSIFMSVLITVLAVLENNAPLAVFGLLSVLVGCCYACVVWARIPFAAANLKTGLTAVKANYGVTFVAYFLVILSVVFSGCVLVAMVGVWSQTSDCKDGTCQEEGAAGIYFFLLLLSLFWTQQVIKNTIHVTVAGTVGEWWFEPNNASSFCSGAIWGSFFRASTYSFGSICLGSLLVALIQTLRQLVHNARRNRDGNSILLCIAECILACLQDLMEYFNKWAYIYVGLYGYDYLEAGKNVMTLFKQRGWTTIISDNLVSNTLSLMCLVLAGLSGCIGVVLNAAKDSWLKDFGESSAVAAFFVAFIIGLVISSVLMSVVDSAVNTVIVCFAEAPAEFQMNHLDLSEEMMDAWRKIYPEECGF